MVMHLTRLTLMVGRIQLVNEDGVVVEPKTHVPYCLWPDRAMKERLLVEKLKIHAMRAGMPGVWQGYGRGMAQVWQGYDSNMGCRGHR